MPVKEVPGYRVECDADDCTDSPQDHGEYAFWMQRIAAIEEASEIWWYVASGSGDQEIVLLCPEHAPRCSCPGCDSCEQDCSVQLLNADCGSLCEDCWDEQGDRTEGGEQRG